MRQVTGEYASSLFSYYQMAPQLHPNETWSSLVRRTHLVYQNNNLRQSPSCCCED
jgi:hypothetical protein